MGRLGRAQVARAEDGGTRPQGPAPGPRRAQVWVFLPCVAGSVQRMLCIAAELQAACQGLVPLGLLPSEAVSEVARRRGQTVGTPLSQSSCLPHRSTAPPPNHLGNLATCFSGRCVEHLQADSCWHSSGGAGDKRGGAAPVDSIGWALEVQQRDTQGKLFWRKQATRQLIS